MKCCWALGSLQEDCPQVGLQENFIIREHWSLLILLGISATVSMYLQYNASNTSMFYFSLDSIFAACAISQDLSPIFAITNTLKAFKNILSYLPFALYSKDTTGLMLVAWGFHFQREGTDSDARHGSRTNVVHPPNVCLHWPPEYEIYMKDA